MSSMEDVIEIFSDAVSGFIMLSVKLQEANAEPQAGLRPAAKAVQQTSEALCGVGRAKGEKEYADYEEIQADIFDCCNEVEKALKLFDPALDVLFGSGERQAGWAKIVRATQQIASHTSRLLLVVYGAEHRRLEMAGYLLLETCGETKPFAMRPQAELERVAKQMVESVNKCSSDTMTFAAYVQARSKEIEGAKAKQMHTAVADFERLNARLVETCNAMMKELTQPNRQAFAHTISEIERITREILDIIKPPEELDVYKQIQALFTKGSMAVGAAGKPLAGVLAAGKPSRDVSPADVRAAGDEVKKALVPVKAHPTVAEREQVIDNTNVASAKAAKYNDVLADYIAGDKVPALKQPLSAAHQDMERANRELVDATNDYLNALDKGNNKKGGGGPQRAATVGGGGGGGDDKERVRTLAKKVAASTAKCVKAAPTDKATFVDGAKDAGANVKDLLAATDQLARATDDAAQRKALQDAAASVRQGVVDTVNAGKQRLASPQDAGAQAAVQKGGGDTARAVKTLLDAVDAAQAANARADGANRGNLSPEEASRVLTDKCRQVEAIIDRVNDQLAPTAKPKRAEAVSGPVSPADLEASADDVLRHIKQLRQYPDKMPAEIAEDGTDLHEVADRFQKQLEARGKTVRNPQVAQKLGAAARDIDGANGDTNRAVNAYLKEPGPTTARGVDTNADRLEQFVRAVMDEVRPKLTLASADTAFAPGSGHAMPAHVTPKHVRDAAEQLKRDNADVKRVDDLSPAALAAATDKASGDAARLAKLLDALGGDTTHAGLKQAIAGHRDALDDANRELVDAAQAHLDDPDDAAARRRLADATAEVDRVADAIIADVAPTDALQRGVAPARQGQVTPEQLERTGKELLDRERRLLAHPDMTPAEVAVAANDASAKAAQFADELRARAGDVRNAQTKAAAQRGADDIDRLNDEQMAATKALLEAGPRDAAAVQRLNDADAALAARTQALIDELRPHVDAKRGGAHQGHVSPADIEAQAKRSKDALHANGNALGAPDAATPAALKDAAERSFADIDKLERMLEAMEAQDDVSPATKAKVKAARARLHDADDRLAALADDALALGGESEAPRRALVEHVADTERLIDQIVDDCKPRATVAQSAGGTGASVAPKQLAALGKQLQAAAREVPANKANAAQLTAKTDAASKLAAQFGDAVADRANAEARPGVKDKLKRAQPRIDAANRRMVAASNALAAKPRDAAAGAEVDAAAQELIDTVQDVLDAVAPPVKLTQSQLKQRGDLASAPRVTMAQLDKDAKDAAEAVREVKKFAAKGDPAATARDAEQASAALAAFGDDLATKAAQTKNPKTRKMLLDAARRMHKHNPALVGATQRYLDEPDSPDAAADLDGTCDLILADIADTMAQLHPKVAIAPSGAYRAGQRVPSGDELRTMGERVKADCNELEAALGQASPPELAAAGQKTLSDADDFRAALNDAKHPKEAALIDAKNKALERALNDALAEPEDPAREAALRKASEELRAAVDDVLGRVRPTVTATSADDAAKTLGAGPVSPDNLAASCEAVVKAAEETQRFKSKEPHATAADADDMSKKAARYAAQVKKLAGQTPNAAQKKRLMDAYADLVDANEGAVAAANDYLGDRESPARQRALDDACENVKRAARAALEAARPRVELGPIPTHTGAVSGDALRDAAEAVRVAVRPLQTPGKLNSEDKKDAAEDTGRKAATFIALARAKAAKVKDPAQKKKLQEVVKALEAEREALAKHTNTHIGQPGNPAKREAVKKSAHEVERLVDEFMGTCKPTATAVRPGPGRGLDTSLESMDAAAEAAKKAVRKHDGQFEAVPNDDAVVDNANEASEKLARFIEHVKAKIAATPDPALKSRLNDQLRALEDDNKALAAKTNAFLNDRANGAAKKALHDANQKTIDDIDKTMNHIRKSMQPRSFADRIDEAAADMRDAAAAFNLIPGELRELGIELADLMRKMAECARNGDRQGIIETARAISAVIKKIQKQAKPFGDNSNDPALADSVLVGVQALGNFGTQLKILASVKAASSGPDPAAENQLVACCTGVSTSMRQTLGGVQGINAKAKGGR